MLLFWFMTDKHYRFKNLTLPHKQQIIEHHVSHCTPEIRNLVLGKFLSSLMCSIRKNDREFRESYITVTIDADKGVI